MLSLFIFFFFFFNDTATTEIYTLSLHDALPISPPRVVLDMTGVTFCDSQGLGTLVVLSRKATLAQSCLVLTNVADFLLRVLDITGLRPALMISHRKPRPPAGAFALYICHAAGSGAPGRLVLELNA